MKKIFFWLALALVSGCAHPGYYYPGSVPKDCKVSDGYCYHRHIVNDKVVVDVYIFNPKYGWIPDHQEVE